MALHVYTSNWAATTANVFDFTLVFYQLIQKLKTKCEVIEHFFNDIIGKVTIDGYEFQAMNCDLIIYDDTQNSVYIVSYCDYHSTSFSILTHRNNSNDVLVWSSLNEDRHVYERYNFVKKIPPYVKRNALYDLDSYYTFGMFTSKRDVMSFRGNYGAMPRNVIFSLKEDPYKKHYSGAEPLSSELYFNDIISSKVALSITGASEFCFRDIEIMAVGTPMLRFEYLTPWIEPLIPNYHYISVPRLDNRINHERFCGEENEQNLFIGRNHHTDRYAEAYINRFLEVKNDTEFLNFISQNARQYYEKYIHQSTRVDVILTLLGI